MNGIRNLLSVLQLSRLCTLSLAIACTSMVCGQTPPADPTDDAELLGVQGEPLPPLVEPDSTTVAPSNADLSNFPFVSPFRHFERYPGPTRYSRGSAILGHLWVNTEILGWATKGQDLPTLVTSSPVGAGVPVNEAGILSRNDTSVLFGDAPVHDKLRIGGRLTAGWWLDDDFINGLEGYYFGIDGEDVQFRAAGTGASILARPYTNSTNGLQESALIAFPGVMDGSIAVDVDMEFNGAGALWRRRVSAGPNHRLDVLMGYRYNRLYDRLTTNETLTSLDPSSGFPAGTDVFRSDLFQSTNEFHGGDFGLVANWRRERWSLQLLGKVALGNTRSEMIAAGRTQTIDALAVSTTYASGVLAQPSNNGRYLEDNFAAVGELGLLLRYSVTCRFHATLGYTYIYWSDVVRGLAGIDAGLDPAQLAPTGGVGARPGFSINDDSFWAQGLNFGLEYEF